ncbi:Helix-turn-helix domain-containing protein [Parafrankia irregularis]|uniref:Helix-turn-helix domain-containing protein n=1 Tax=Parafrankia irregularis TaxID=795642 RepID=A0A0S4R0I0_9ACTN|nr:MULTISPECIES: helix-turn-helix transcriptional regulator [Parafrankia]MBE3206603.1 helix-turn-helix transcriptional regulator [Parafrankia sp. CH37]MBE3206725.1 helix-turn-helix transcriptional regulator [Parafrankia sp. CH37]CUU61251.1 Helix-turn-helix domain-containing protein [Parafrankia irregularis]
MDNRAIGRRVRYWRTRRNLSRAQLANRCDRSVSWLDKIESGERNLLRVPMLERVASALEIPVAALTEDAVAERSSQCLDAVEVQALRTALGSYDTLLGGRMSRDPNLARLRAQVDHACAAWLSSRFTVIGRVLPDLMRDAQAAVRTLDGEPRLEATRHLVMTYRLTSSTLLKFEDTDVAWLAADRAITLATESEDTICLARATRSVARAMTQFGQLRAAIDVLIAMADRMEPDLAGDHELMSLYGMLLLAAEIAAASDGDASTALDLHERADAVAHTLGPRYAHRTTAFGVTNVALHRLAALVRLHEGAAALAHARTIPADAIARLPQERKANYLLDLAEAHRQTGNNQDAGRVLLHADRTAPEEVRCRPVARQLLEQLLEQPDASPTPQLRQLARRIGLPA